MQTRESNDDAVDELDRWATEDDERFRDFKYLLKAGVIAAGGVVVFAGIVWSLGGFS